jgi:hypothetical protein
MLGFILTPNLPLNTILDREKAQFDPNGKRRGMGLGLYVTKRLLRKMNRD